jgi:hypothetical protein
MRVRTRGSASRDLELPVPFGMPLELSVRSAQFELEDERRQPIDPAPRRGTRIEAAPGSPSIVHTFHVIGRRAAP